MQIHAIMRMFINRMGMPMIVMMMVMMVVIMRVGCIARLGFRMTGDRRR